MNTHESLLDEIGQGNFRILARVLSLVENNLEPSARILRDLKYNQDTPVIGITGPPGAGKSTLVNALIDHFTALNLKVAILAVDPTSPFNFGSLLGDRIRMAAQFNKPNVFIRSIATRGALGGISAKTIEMADVLKAAGFDLILIETVGVGQSEVEIAGLADRTIVVLVPESGDEVQHIKSGLMEIADGFVVNKADRDGADVFTNQLKKLVHQGTASIPVFKTIADKQVGIEELADWILNFESAVSNSRKALLYAEKAWNIIQEQLTRNINKIRLREEITKALSDQNFNLYRFVEEYLEKC